MEIFPLPWSRTVKKDLKGTSRGAALSNRLQGRLVLGLSLIRPIRGQEVVLLSVRRHQPANSRNNLILCCCFSVCSLYIKFLYIYLLDIFSLYFPLWHIASMNPNTRVARQSVTLSSNFVRPHQTVYSGHPHQQLERDHVETVTPWSPRVLNSSV